MYEGTHRKETKLFLLVSLDQPSNREGGQSVSLLLYFCQIRTAAGYRGWSCVLCKWFKQHLYTVSLVDLTFLLPWFVVLIKCPWSALAQPHPNQSAHCLLYLKRSYSISLSSPSCLHLHCLKMEALKELRSPFIDKLNLLPRLEGLRCVRDCL